VRNLIGTTEYKKIFPEVTLAADSKSAGRWNTNQGGVFYATGVGSSLAGRGADMLIIDDPHSEQDMLTGNFAALENAYKWYTIGARTRLMKNGRVAIVATRWHKADLIGRVIKNMASNPEADQFEVVEFPAILNENTDDEKALWSDFFDLEALKRTKASMPAYQWNAQYQQNPTGESSALVKREDFRVWEKLDAPKCEYIIQAVDAAAELKERSDYTSISTWGIFWNETDGAYNLILLNSVRDRFEFPELKAKALEQYQYWEPDVCLVEKKSSGTALYQEMRRGGIPVSEYTPHRGTINSPNTKFVRLNSVVDMIKSGLVWVPDTRWAEQLVEEVAEFPYGDHDDCVDTTIMALIRFRLGGFAVLPTDETDDEPLFKSRRGGYY
jgi:predicted phage terminase large subunit-like protein